MKKTVSFFIKIFLYTFLTEFSETYSFYSHHSMNQRVEYIDEEKSKDTEFLNEKFKPGFPFLITREYKFNKDSPVHNDINMDISDLTIEESKQVIRKRIKEFVKINDTRYRKFFFSALMTYVKILNYDEIEKELFPLITKNLFSFNDDLVTYLTKIIFVVIEYLYKTKEKEEIDKDLKGLKKEEEKNIINNEPEKENDKLNEDKKNQELVNKIYLIKSQLIPLIFQIFISRFFQDFVIRNTIFNSILLIARKVRIEEYTQLLFSKIIDTLNTNNLFTYNSRIEYLSIMTKIIRIIIPDYNVEFNENILLAYLQILCCDDNVLIRRQIVKTLPIISKKISINSHINKLRPLYKILCIDKDISIRIESVDILPDIMKDNQEKSQFSEGNEYYVELFNKFMLDQDKSVRIATLSSFGRFIMLLDMNELDKKYLDFYKNVIDEYYFYRNQFDSGNPKDKSKHKLYTNANTGTSKGTIDIITRYRFLKTLYDEEIEHEYESNINLDNVLISIAKNFPSMLFRFGKENWSILKSIYIRLANDEDINIITIIIKSFYNVGAILGKEIVKNELIDIYNNFLYSKDLNVQQVAIDYLSNLLRLLDFDEKKKYVKFISDFILKDIQEKIFITKNADLPIQENIVMFYSHEHKLKATKNINYYFDLFTEDKIFSNYLRLVLVLCCDRIHLIRKESSVTLGNIFLYLYNRNYKKDMMIKIIRGFALSKNFKMRIEFLYICSTLLRDKNVFDEFLFDLMLNCYFDTVYDVQIQLTLLVNSIIKQEDVNLNYILKNKKFCALALLIFNDPMLNEFLSTEKSVYDICLIKEDDEELNNIYTDIKNNYKHLLPDDLVFQEIMIKLNLKMEVDKEKEKEDERIRKSQNKTHEIHIIE